MKLCPLIIILLQSSVFSMNGTLQATVKAIDYPTSSISLRCSSCSSSREQQENTKLHNNVKAILNAFTTIISGIIAIKQDPHNPEHVGIYVNNMVGSLINVGIQASKNGSPTTTSCACATQLVDLLLPLLLRIIDHVSEKSTIS